MCCKLMAPASFPLLVVLAPDMLASTARSLPKPMQQGIAAFLRSPECRIPEMQRSRAIEVVDSILAGPPPSAPARTPPAVGAVQQGGEALDGQVELQGMVKRLRDSDDGEGGGGEPQGKRPREEQ